MTPESATRTLTDLRRLRPGWNYPGSAQITEDALKTAHVLLTEEPMVVPCSDGGIQFEWHTKSVNFEFRIAPDGAEELE